MFNKLITLRTPDDTARDRSATRRRRRAARSAPAVRTRRSRLRAARRVRQRSRRGVLLLVVLSMLVLFLLMGTAFVISARQEQAASKSIAKASQVAAARTAESSLLDEVLGQIVRDTKNTSSSLRSHSLLLDMYGNDGYTSVIAANKSTDASTGNEDPTTVRWPVVDPKTSRSDSGVTAGQLLELDLQVFTDFYGRTFGSGSVSTGPLSVVPEQLAGRVLTFLSGPVKGQSVRIVNSRRHPSGLWLTLTVVAPKQTTGTPLPPYNGERPDDVSNRLQQMFTGVKVAINGQPFNGTGVGYDATLPPSPSESLPPNADVPGYRTGTKPYVGPRLIAFSVTDNVSLTPAPVALLPNTAFFDPLTPIAPGTPAIGVRYESGATLLGDYFPRLASAPVLSQLNLAGLGGEDESYDAPDFQNMLLAGMDVPNNGQFRETAWNNAWFDPSTPPPTTGVALENMVLPSLHRPALLNYWRHQTMSGPAAPLSINPELLRRVLMRPNWLDHPNFSGSNPEFDAVLGKFQNALDADGNLTGASVPPAAEIVLNRMIYGPWDVDNDNDGVRDSVWVDFGAPVVNGPNGRRYKPLAAILCLDLAGRLDVNAHGSLALADVESNPVSDPAPNSGNGSPLTPTLAGAVAFAAAPKGQGYGPADISLEAAIGPDFRRLLVGDTVNGEFLPGRYGSDALPGLPKYLDAISQVARFGWPSVARSQTGGGGWTQTSGFFASLPDLNARYSVGLNPLGQALEQSVVEWTLATRASAIDGANTLQGMLRDAPYEMDLSAAANYGEVENAVDSAFSLAEMERVLRLYDADSSTLPGRLATLSGVATDDNSDRLRIATDIYDVPVPNVTLPANLRELMVTELEEVYPNNIQAAFQAVAATGASTVPRTAADLFEIRVRAALRETDSSIPPWPLPLPLPTDPTDFSEPQNKVRAVMQRIVAPELLAGRKLNLNRPFGNGQDDNNNGVVDEPGEDSAAARRQIWQAAMAVDSLAPAASQPAIGASVTAMNRVAVGTAAEFPGSYDVVVDTTIGEGLVFREADPRQMYARQLYVLALNTAAPADFDPLTKDSHKALARSIAQWAINVVEFRDADNIMTPFEFDLNPFDGWDVDGWIGRTGPDQIMGTADDQNTSSPDDVNTPHRDVVWGAERPELLITEQMAWHDRRTQNLASEDPIPASDPRAMMPDLPPDFDPATDIGQNKPLDPQKHDVDYDQLTRPQGAWFIELYNPWAPNPNAQGDTHLTLANAQRTLQNMPNVPQPNDVVSDLTATYPATADLGVNLAAVSQVRFTGNPTNTNNSPRRNRPSPVWRLITYKDGLRDFPPNSETRPKDPDNPYTGPNQAPRHRPVNVDRSVYFTGAANGDPAYSDDGVAYFNSATDPSEPTWVRPVRPGRHMVVGSGFLRNGRYESALGDPTDPNTPDRRRRIALNPGNDGLEGLPAAQPIQFLGDGVRGNLLRPRVPGQNNAAGVPNLDVQGFESGWSVSDVAIIDRVDRNSTYELGRNANTAPAFRAIERRLTLSEPALGYQSRNLGGANDTRWSPGVGLHNEGQYRDGNDMPKAVDVPLDDPSMRYDGETRLTRMGLVPNFQWVYLQRLANPLLPYNPEPGHPDHEPTMAVNPYRTIDDQSANVFVFNGLDKEEYKSMKLASQLGNVAANPGNNPRQAEYRSADEEARDFASMERGWGQDPQANRLNATLNTRNLWSPENPWLQGRPNQRPPGDGRVGGIAPFNFNGRPDWSLGYINGAFSQNAAPQVRGVAPDAPFAALSWPNRPLISETELLQVPAVRSSQLLRAFGAVDQQDTDDDWPYHAAEPLSDNLFPPPAENPNRYPFGHLMNFFYEGPSSGNSLPANTTAPATGLSQLLDLVDVNSQFAGTETWLNPAYFASSNVTGAVAPIRDRPTSDARAGLQAPYNTVSEFREPGMVNLNTVFDQQVYRGLFHTRASDEVRPDAAGNGAHPGPWWRVGANQSGSFTSSRRGYSTRAVEPDPFLLDPNVPTFFANPFRAPGAYDLAPLAQMIRLSRGEVGLLRSDKAPRVTTGTGTLAANLTAANGPLQITGDDDPPLFGSQVATNSAPAFDAQQNSMFRWAPATRMGSMTSTHSNIYAVWITIGFFEVEEFDDTNRVDQAICSRFLNGATTLQQLTADAAALAAFQRVYPHSLKYGKEIGIDTGEVRRLRGFYIIDRSLPAAFEPGVDHNMENVVRIRRRIE